MLRIQNNDNDEIQNNWILCTKMKSEWNSPTSRKVTTLHIMNNAAFALFHNSKTSCSSVVS